MHHPDHVPAAGFAAAFRRIERAPVPGPVLRDLLGLIGYRVTLRALAHWPIQKRVEAELYASRVHLHASDAPGVRVPPRPGWMPDPWQGKRGRGWGVFSAPGGTVLP